MIRMLRMEAASPLGPPIKKPEPVKPDPFKQFEKGNQRLPDGRVQGEAPKHQMMLITSPTMRTYTVFVQCAIAS